MLQGFYSAVTGAQQQMLRMDVQANNISNVNTNGYKAQVPAFQALMYGMLDGIEGEQLPRGSGAYLSATGTNQAVGSYRQTERTLDYAIVGQGFFALYDPSTDTVTYTRDGAFTMAAFPVQGTGGSAFYLSDGEGRQVLDAAGQPIPVTDPSVKLPVGVFNIQYQDGLQRTDSSRFAVGAKNGTVTAVNSQVEQGLLEESNVDLATELTQVIEAQRSYSYVLKMVQTADEVESTVIGLTNG